ncbi:GAP family protein [Aquihabitans sp. McL0605]|uniref:GAP family protein n=1 Tax=Aquihabitans sp. McL0605 TaxID=3415671 RepID=UPI003CE67D31
MSDLVRTLIVCGLISGTQPFTIMGMFLVLGGNNGNRNVWWYLFGCFSIQFVIVVIVGELVGGTVDSTSSPGRSLIGLRVAAGFVLVLLGLWLRRAPTKEAPETPKAFDRLNTVGAGAAYIGGILIADYQGSVLAASALATADVTHSQVLIGWAVYCLFATGLPVLAAFATIHSARAEANLHRTIDWVMRNRRALASWICIIGGLFLFGDGLADYVKASG